MTTAKVSEADEPRLGRISNPPVDTPVVSVATPLRPIRHSLDLEARLQFAQNWKEIHRCSKPVGVLDYFLGRPRGDLPGKSAARGDRAKVSTLAADLVKKIPSANISDGLF